MENEEHESGRDGTDNVSQNEDMNFEYVSINIDDACNWDKIDQNFMDLEGWR